ncbi:MAG: c-type cytochrome [Hyphomicrobium sp.]
MVRAAIATAAGLLAITAPAAAMAQETTDPSPPAALTGISAYGRDIYQGRCSNCHSIQPGESSLAPTLHGLIGRKAASIEGFPYSEKLTHLDLVWSADSLDAWLSTSSLDSPLLRMRHLGVESPADREALVAYLSTVK